MGWCLSVVASGGISNISLVMERQVITQQLEICDAIGWPEQPSRQSSEGHSSGQLPREESAANLLNNNSYIFTTLPSKSQFSVRSPGKTSILMKQD